MANPFTVTPLGGFNLGGAIAQLGQQFGEQKRRDEQMMQEQEFQGLLKRAYETGNQEDIAEVFSMNPQIGEFLTNREAEKAQKLGAENLARAREAEVDWGIRWKQASTPEQKEALKQEALNNPLIDIDEDDLGISGQQADLGVDAMLFGHLGKDQFKALGLGPQESQVKTQVVQTPTGSQVINQQTGEVIRNVENPEKRQQFELSQKERTQKLKTQERKEKADIKKAKIAERDATQARQDTVQSGARAFALTNELLEEGVIEDVTGKLDRFGASIGLQTGVEGDILNKANQLKDLMTLENLSLMKGPLTDSDIKILASAASGLNIDENGFVGSTKGVTNQIKKIQSMLDMKLKSAVKRGDLSQLEYERITNPQAQQDGFSSLWGG